MSRINIGELSLNYHEVGSGEPILFIPGMMGLLEAWKFQMEYFSNRYRCISFDHRGTGESDKPPNAYSGDLNCPCYWYVYWGLYFASDGY